MRTRKNKTPTVSPCPECGYNGRRRANRVYECETLDCPRKYFTLKESENQRKRKP